MSRMFKIVKDEVKYPTFCPQGIYIQQVGGKKLIPVENSLAMEWESKEMVGKALVREDLDFEFLDRKRIAPSSWEKSAFLCDKGEISGGSIGPNGWIMSIVGTSKKYLASELTPIQVAEPLSTPHKIEERRWKVLYEEFIELDINNMTSIEIVDWFKARTNLKPEQSENH